MKIIILLQKTFANSHMLMQADVGVSWLKVWTLSSIKSLLNSQNLENIN